ncbi:MAG: metallophosphoesterase family protein [Candidatus Hodarchaeales archaeon]|jgi:DNA repair exonuclease SbcCD nuclease subunit
MQQRTISFLHLADTHFGVHYAIRPKNQLRRAYGEAFFQKAKKVMEDAIIKHNVDFIIHSGDFFNRSKPPPEVVDRAVTLFNLATNNHIPIYIIPGNHERGKLPIGLLSFQDNIKLFDKPCSFFFEKNGIFIKLTGFPYIRNAAKENFNNAISKAWQNTRDSIQRKGHYSIFATHQLIEGSCVENYTFRRGPNVVSFHQIPKKFNYVACGHVHRFQFLYERLRSRRSTNQHYSIIQDFSNDNWHFKSDQGIVKDHFNNPIISYPGSLERVSMAERNEPKGYIIGQLLLSEDENTIQEVQYRFHELSAIKMKYFVWDLTKATLSEYIEKTYQVIQEINSQKGEEHFRERNELRAVFRIKLKGKNITPSKSLDILKQKAKRFKIYLTFSYISKSEIS